MAIHAYVGLNGSGKSYSAVKYTILPSLKEKRIVVTNIPLVMEEIEKEIPWASEYVRPFKSDEVDAAWFAKNFVAGAVYVIDEVIRYWPTGKKESDFTPEEMEFFSMHRHLVGEDGNTTQIYVVLPDLASLASAVRRLVEKTFRTINLEHMGMPSHYNVGVYTGAVTGQNPPKSQLVNSTGPHKYEKKIQAMYKSATRSQTGGVGNEARIDKRGSVWRRPLILFGIPIGLVMLVWGSYASYQKIRYPHGQPEAAQQQTAQAKPATDVHDPHVKTAVEPVKPVDPPAPKISATWRIMAMLNDSAHGHKVAITKNGFIFRYIPAKDCEWGDDLRCTVDGEYVTYWSGVTPNNSGAGDYVSTAYNASRPEAPAMAAPVVGRGAMLAPVGVQPTGPEVFIVPSSGGYDGIPSAAASASRLTGPGGGDSSSRVDTWRQSR